MDKQHIKGALDKAKGAVKDAIGKVIGDDGMRIDGKVDKLKGEGREAIGDMKDAMRDADAEAHRGVRDANKDMKKVQ